VRAAVYRRKATPNLETKNLSQLSAFLRTTSSLLVPTNIAELAVYPDISPQHIQANSSPSQVIHGAVNATSTPIQDMGIHHPLTSVWPIKCLDRLDVPAIGSPLKGSSRLLGPGAHEGTTRVAIFHFACRFVLPYPALLPSAL